MMLIRKLLILPVVFMLGAGVAGATFFFPEDGSPVDNYKAALPRGYDDPDVIYGRDKEIPKVVLSHTPRLEAESGKNYDISVNVRNLPEGAIVVLHYRTDPTNQYRDIPMQEITPELYSVTIPGRTVDDDLLQYYIDVTFVGNLLANSGDFGNPHRVVLRRSNGFSLIGIIIGSVIGGLWLISRIRSRGKEDEPRVMPRRMRQKPVRSGR
jgi:hypothetical protein